MEVAPSIDMSPTRSLAMSGVLYTIHESSESNLNASAYQINNTPPTTLQTIIKDLFSILEVQEFALFSVPLEDVAVASRPHVQRAKSTNRYVNKYFLNRMKYK